MRAIDTNVVVRFLTADDPEQAQVARTVVAGGDIYIPVTVMLEAEWVLRVGYGFTAAKIASALRGLGGLAGVTVEDPAALAKAIEWMNDGLDFADALHLARASHCSAFVTFDHKLAKRAKGMATPPVAMP